jgi:hypothetical protein
MLHLRPESPLIRNLIKSIRLLQNPLLPLLQHFDCMFLTDIKPLFVRLITAFTLPLQSAVFQFDVNKVLDAADMRYLHRAFVVGEIEVFASALPVPFLQPTLEIVCIAYLQLAEVMFIPEYVYVSLLEIGRQQWLSELLAQSVRYGKVGMFIVVGSELRGVRNVGNKNCCCRS